MKNSILETLLSLIVVYAYSCLITLVICWIFNMTFTMLLAFKVLCLIVLIFMLTGK